MPRPLRHGYTTGACAAAAALGAARMLREQAKVESVELWLPAGFAASFPLHGQSFGAESARCFVVKDAGDDPDVTHGVEVHAEVSLVPPSPRPSPARGEGEKILPPPRVGGGEGGGGIVLVAGTGIGRVTKPGLAVPPGEAAINPVPQRMIREAVEGVFSGVPFSLRVTLSIPDGEARARRTLNERLGIVGGLSILGTTGIVRPVSHQAWTDTIDAALEVARAAGCRTAVLSTGRTSELAAQRELGTACRAPTDGCPAGLPEEAFIMMGDFVGHAVEACARRGFPDIVLAAQFAKLVKIAAGHDQTHVRDARLDLAELAKWARRSGLDEAEVETIEWANTARQALETTAHRDRLAAAAGREALVQLRRRAPKASIGILLVGYDGTATRFGAWPETIGEDPGGIG